MKVNREQLERETESLDNTFTLECYTLEARDKLAKIQVHCDVERVCPQFMYRPLMNSISIKEKIKHLKQVVLPERTETKECGSTGQLTAAESRCLYT